MNKNFKQTYYISTYLDTEEILIFHVSKVIQFQQNQPNARIIVVEYSEMSLKK